MPAATCSLGCFAKTGKAALVAVAPGPDLVAKWDIALVPATQERFVYHAAQLMESGAARFVKRSTEVVGTHTADVIGTVLDELAARRVRVTGAAVVGREVELPGPLEKILASHTLLHSAEGALYRGALVDALDDHGITCTLVPRDDLGDVASLASFGKVPAPWRKEHKDAALAALRLVRAGGRGSAPRTARAVQSRRRA
jgi:hypothetical protein